MFRLLFCRFQSLRFAEGVPSFALVFYDNTVMRCWMTIMQIQRQRPIRLLLFVPLETDSTEPYACRQNKKLLLCTLTERRSIKTARSTKETSFATHLLRCNASYL